MSNTVPISRIKRLAALHGAGKNPSVAYLARVLGLCRGSVRRYRKLIEASGHSFAYFATMSEKEIWRILRQQAAEKEPTGRQATLSMIFPEIQGQVQDGSKNLKQSWLQYRKTHRDGYEYSQFVRLFQLWGKQRAMKTTACAKWHVAHLPQEDLSALRKWRNSNNRTRWAKAVALMESYKGANLASLCVKIEKSPRIVKRWMAAYDQKGIAGLDTARKRQSPPAKLAEMDQKRDRIIEILHETPQLHGINRASWSLDSLVQAYKAQYSESVSMSTVSDYIRSEGFTFKKARRVLTSPDPDYREKLKEITSILSSLREDEKFFSVDEFGPFSVTIRGGRTHTERGTNRVIPQWQKSKGRIILTAGLELSTNQIRYFYSEKKNTGEMIRLLDILLHEYADQRCLYLSWDAASWHISAKLKKRVAAQNNMADMTPIHGPIVKLAPLPASAQFLNVIESIFSGMARAVLHNSDYQSVGECKEAIDRHFEERNEHYRRNPARAGKKIWGKELVEPYFSPSNNCKDPKWR